MAWLFESFDGELRLSDDLKSELHLPIDAIAPMHALYLFKSRKNEVACLMMLADFRERLCFDGDSPMPFGENIHPGIFHER